MQRGFLDGLTLCCGGCRSVMRLSLPLLTLGDVQMTGEQRRVCAWDGCDLDLSAMHPNAKYCHPHGQEARRARHRMEKTPRVCAVDGCNADISNLHHLRKRCDVHNDPSYVPVDKAIEQIAQTLVADARDALRGEAAQAWLEQLCADEDPDALAFFAMLTGDMPHLAETLHLPKLAARWRAELARGKLTGEADGGQFDTVL